MIFGLFFCLLRFRITKFVITETLLSGVTFKTIMIPLHRGRFLVVHLYSSVSYGPSKFSLRGKVILKIAISNDFEGPKPTFLKPQW